MVLKIQPGVDVIDVTCRMVLSPCCNAPAITFSSKLRQRASSCVTEHEEENMKTYNANPGYEMDPSSWGTFNQHLIHYSGSIRNCYRSEWILLNEKNTFSFYGCACRYIMCAEMMQLINEVGEKLVGHAGCNGIYGT